MTSAEWRERWHTLPPSRDEWDRIIADLAAEEARLAKLKAWARENLTVQQVDAALDAMWGET